MTQRAAFRWLELAFALSASGCAAGSEGAPNPVPSSSAAASNCSTRADALAVGLSRLSSNGTRFELVELVPPIPVQSTSPPGNHWSVAVRDGAGNALSGGVLNVTTYMPDHGHAGPPSVGLDAGDGVYAIDALLFPMPALYDVTLGLNTGEAPSPSVSVHVCVEASSG